MLAAAGAEQPAVAARWWVAVPYLPRLEDPREQLRCARGHARAGGRCGRRIATRPIESARVTRADRGRAARRRDRDLSARRYADARAAVGAASPRGRCRSATWPARRGAARSRPRPRSSRHATHAIGSSTRVLRGRRLRDRRRRGSPAGCVTPTERSRRSCTSAPRPRYTDPSWLSHLLCCPLPATLAVHISVGGRAREQARQRRRWKRLRAAVLYKERRDRVVGSDEQEALEEAAVVDAELAAEIGASVYRVGIYCSIRDPHGRARAVQPHRQADRRRVSRAHQRPGDPRPAAVPARVHVDAAARRRRAPRDPKLRAAEHRPLRRADLEPVRLPGGVIVGTADPGGTLERADPFDPVHPRRVTLDRRPVGRRQDRAHQRAVPALHRPRRAHLHPRPLLHPRRARQHSGHRPLRHARVADPRLPPRPGRTRRRRRDLPVGRRRPRAASRRTRPSCCSRCTRC